MIKLKEIKRLANYGLINLLSIIIGCSNPYQYPNQDYSVLFDINLPIDENGFYHLSLDSNNWQTLHRVKGVVTESDNFVEGFWVEWESDLYWYLGDTLGYIVTQFLSETGTYVSVDTSFMIGFNGMEVPTSNKISYSNLINAYNDKIIYYKRLNRLIESKTITETKKSLGNMNLKGKHILLTGGSLGIGKETAKILVEKGAKVLITGRSAQRLEEASKYTGAQTLVFDISDQENISDNAQQCIEALDGKVDALINNAGIGSFQKIEDVTFSDFEQIFNTNVFGLALLSKFIISIMKEQKSGTIINIGSSASVKGFAGGSVYAASKFAVRALTQCWQAELRPFNIRVCQLNPSEVTTAFYNEERKERAEVYNKLSPKEIAHSILSVLEMEDKGFITELNVWATNPF